MSTRRDAVVEPCRSREVMGSPGRFTRREHNTRTHGGEGKGERLTCLQDEERTRGAPAFLERAPKRSRCRADPRAFKYGPCPKSAGKGPGLVPSSRLLLHRAGGGREGGGGFLYRSSIFLFVFLLSLFLLCFATLCILMAESPSTGLPCRDPEEFDGLPGCRGRQRGGV